MLTLEQAHTSICIVRTSDMIGFTHHQISLV
jgi:hypothetical protein